MKPKRTNLTPVKNQRKGAEGSLPPEEKRMLRRGAGKKRAALSPSQLHSKRFGH
jgi:hypothetical protein